MENCHDCGISLTPGARFCAACGAPADSEQTRFAADLAGEETRVAAPARPRPVQPLQQVRPASPPPAPRADARAAQAEEQTIFTVRPTLLFVKLGYALAALGGLLLVALRVRTMRDYIPYGAYLCAGTIATLLIF